MVDTRGHGRPGGPDALSILWLCGAGHILSGRPDFAAPGTEPDRKECGFDRSDESADAVVGKYGLVISPDGRTFVLPDGSDTLEIRSLG